MPNHAFQPTVLALRARPAAERGRYCKNIDMHMTGIRRALGLTIVLGAALGGQASGAQFSPLNIDLNRAVEVARNMGSSANPMPEADEIALGRELAGRLLGGAPLVDDDSVQRYINRVGRLIAAQSERPDLPWRFGVVDKDSFNAYSMPGGIVLVTRGLYEALDDEAQLAGVLGHAIAAIARRHHVEVPRRIASAANVYSIGQAVIAQRMNRPEILTKILEDGAELFARGLERNVVFEADRLAIELAARVGYDFYGLIEVLHRLQIRSAPWSVSEQIYSTHPLPEERLVCLGDAIMSRTDPLPEGIVPPIQRIVPGIAPQL